MSDSYKRHDLIRKMLENEACFHRCDILIREILKTIPELIFEADLKGVITYYYNMDEFGGYSIDEIVNGSISIFDLITDEDRRRALTNTVKIIKGENIGVSEYNFISKNGKPMPIKVHSNVVKSDGKPVGIRGIIIDTTKEKAVQDRIKKSELMYRTIFESTGTAMAIIEEDKKISLTNTEFQKITGYSKIDVENKVEWCKLIHDEDLNLIREIFEILISNPNSGVNSYEIRFNKKNGQVRNGIININKLPDQNNFVISIIDITKRKETEEKLKYYSTHDCLTGLRNRARFTQEIARLEGEGLYPVGIIMCDLDLLKEVNDSYGHDAGDAIIIKAAEIIKSCFRDDDTVARIGGDEFGVILPLCDEKRISSACKDIKRKIKLHNKYPINLALSMSVGYCITNGEIKLKDAVKTADNNMYADKVRNKLNRAK